MQKQLLEYQLRNRLDSQEPSFDSSVLMKFKQEIDNLKFDNVNLSDRLTQMVIENGSLIEKIARTECQRDKLKDKLSDLQQNFDINVTQLENQFTNNNLDDSTVRIAQNENLKAYIEKCKDVQKKLQDLQNDEALLLQEASFEKGNEENDEEFDEEKFISRHSAASKQLEHLLKQITDKEKLIKDSAMNMEQFEQLKADHQ
uniref:Uncharacterized protein n=1 Tax=Romanomermis culicivorax TaxID=13658 RepID=A0A915JH09_ROMCU